jgi:hypothetical protein
VEKYLTQFVDIWNIELTPSRENQVNFRSINVFNGVIPLPFHQQSSYPNIKENNRLSSDWQKNEKINRLANI